MTSCNVNRLAAVDHRKRFVDLVVGWPGSVGDGRIWNNSGLNTKLERFLCALPPIYVSMKATNTSLVQQEAVQAFILADSAYSSTSRMVPTFKTTECNRCPITKKLNYKLASIRYSIENAFGLCKGRFRLLNRPLESAKEDIVRAIKLIATIFILHNFLIDVQDNTDIEPEEEANHETYGEADEDEDVDEVEPNDVQEGPETRAILQRHMRWLETG
jgi:DDE superfamily endonuclease